MINFHFVPRGRHAYVFWLYGRSRTISRSYQECSRVFYHFFSCPLNLLPVNGNNFFNDCCGCVNVKQRLFFLSSCFTVRTVKRAVIPLTNDRVFSYILFFRNIITTFFYFFHFAPPYFDYLFFAAAAAVATTVYTRSHLSDMTGRPLAR